MSSFMQIAIIGAGFSGLALCYHLLSKEKRLSIFLFDCKGSSSMIASGLLHPFPGEKGRLSWQGIEAMEASRRLLDLAGETLGKEVYKKTGILRMALAEEQRKEFRKRIEEFPEIEWWEEKHCKEVVKGGVYAPGMFIPSGLTVYSSLYLQGLLKLSLSLGAKLVEKEVDIEELKGFDQIIIAAGGGIRKFKICSTLPLKFNKGQILLCKKPSYLKPLPHSVIGKGYLALSEREEECYLGSTYEHAFFTEAPCLGEASERIFSQIEHFIPSHCFFQIEQCFAGIRVNHKKSYHPVVGRLEKWLWLITGMGSRGLLYHSYLAEKLAEAVLNNKEDLLPKEVAIAR
ncbi:MAG: FAD-binding oxidoreductase [Simkania negevensis]|nr:FAD-binding oxidoreductase [Simkania negevensis]